MRTTSTIATLRRSASALALVAMASLSVAPVAAQDAAPAPEHWKYYPEPPRAPAGAPNVLLVMTDDVGFGASSTFGGPVPTPTFDALAKDGLRYNAFHTTAMCSPTRAALLTGRNHHAVSSGSIADVSIDQEGYTSVIPKSAATIGRVLHDNGYDTAFFGKNHNTPNWEHGPMGPFDNWPNAWGFDYYYGFNGAAMDQFNPALVENRNPVRPPDQPGYILDRDLGDHVLHWLRVQHVERPDHPFFAYWAPGSTHSPHMAPPEWIARFKGQFDQGWDKLREQSFARQKKLGVVPANAVLTPRPASLPAWKSLTKDQQRIYARMMEVAAGQLAYVDYQIGRVIEDLRQSGELDNTMVIYIQGDNGASMEDFKGSNQELRTLYGVETTDAELARDIDQLGGPYAYGNYPAAWAWATNTPFQWGKQVASHLGGLRDGMVISWPDRIKEIGQVRTQFSHVIDIAPTIYEAAHIAPPAVVDGVKQQPIDGVSMVYTFDHPEAPTRHREQYFEMLGNRAYYKDGWMASTVPGRAPWDRQTKAPDPDAYAWQLYNLNVDWSQSKDVAKTYPQKLAELRADFDAAAAKYHIYPLHNDLLAMLGAQNRPSLLDGRTRFTFYAGDTRYAAGSFPGVGPGWTISAKVSVGAGLAEGPVLVQGDHFGGQALLLEGGKPTFIYNPLGGSDHVLKLQSATPLAAGEHELVVGFAAKGPQGATIQLSVDGQVVAEAAVDRYFRVRGDAYVGERGVAPLLDGGDGLAASCGCAIGSVTIEKSAAR